MMGSTSSVLMVSSTGFWTAIFASLPPTSPAWCFCFSTLMSSLGSFFKWLEMAFLVSSAVLLILLIAAGMTCSFTFFSAMGLLSFAVSTFISSSTFLSVSSTGPDSSKSSGVAFFSIVFFTTGSTMLVRFFLMLSTTVNSFSGFTSSTVSVAAGFCVATRPVTGFMRLFLKLSTKGMLDAIGASAASSFLIIFCCCLDDDSSFLLISSTLFITGSMTVFLMLTNIESCTSSTTFFSSSFSSF
mmetsp:Transcript_9708/g.14433  ORF Transcript_9708/g.14433 Transcript_9708/m.14433 type:complete len:242 (+) Transcript_9708:1971-2696(+)